MGQPSIYYDSPSLQIADAYQVTLAFTVAAAVSPATGFVMVPYPANNVSLSPGFYKVATAPTALTQPIIDGFLGTTNEFLLASFSGATLLTTSSSGLIVNMNGQAKDVYAGEAMLTSAVGVLAAFTDHVYLPRVSALGTTLANRIAVGADGNIGLQFEFTTAVAAGMNILIKLFFRPN